MKSTIQNGSSKDVAAGYNRFKEFEGKKYTGMKIGRGHKWYYDQGVWTEKKITPDLWECHFEVTKRRAGKAPEGSGVPVGTGYHWYIAAHQTVTKLNANDYSTKLEGLKFKVAHKRADKGTWSASEAAQRRQLIKFLHQLIHDLEHPPAEPDPAVELKKPRAKRAVKKVEPAVIAEPRRPRAKPVKNGHGIPTAKA
jgi:hypothetical protein